VWGVWSLSARAKPLTAKTHKVLPDAYKHQKFVHFHFAISLNVEKLKKFDLWHQTENRGKSLEQLMADLTFLISYIEYPLN
jgi:hypothetical protein